MPNLQQEIILKRDMWKSDRGKRTTLYTERKLNYDGLNRPKTQAGHEHINPNYNYAIVEKMAAFLFGSPMSFDIKPDDASDDLEVERAQSIENIIKECFERSRHKTTNQVFGKTGSIYGDSFLKLLVDDEKAPYFDAIEKSQNIILGFSNDNYNAYDYVIYEYRISKTRAKDLYNKDFASGIPLTEISSTSSAGYGVLNKTDPLNMLSGSKTSTIFPEDKNFITVTEYWDENKHGVLINDQLVFSEDNPWGFIPYYHYKNIIKPGEPWGISDIEHVADIVEKHNLKLSEEADAVKQYVYKKLKTNSPSIEPGEIKWDRSQLFKLLNDEDISFLYDQTTIFPSEANITRLMKAIQDIGFTPEGTFGGIDVSNISGRALSLLFQSVIQVITTKRNQLEYIYKDLIADMVLVTQKGFPEFDAIVKAGGHEMFDNTIEIRFGEILPEDKESIIRNIQNMRAGKTSLVSDYTAMKMMGITNPSEEMKKIWEEKKKDMEFNIALQQSMEQMTKPQQPEQGFQRSESQNEAEGAPGAGIPSYSGTPGGANVASPQGAINQGEQQTGAY